MIRRVRRVCDLSQRDLAARMGVSKSTVNRWESEDGEPSLSQLQQLLALAGWSLSIGPDPRENNGVEPSPMRADAARDLQGRRYPAHLDVIGFDSWEVFRVRNPRSGPWRRSPRRETRDEQRRISGVVPDDHANDFELAQETRARREPEIRRRETTGIGYAMPRWLAANRIRASGRIANASMSALNCPDARPRACVGARSRSSTPMGGSSATKKRRPDHAA